GRTGAIASKNCAVVACQSSMQRSPPVHRRDSGACPDTRRSNKPCATTISTHSVFPDSSSPPKLNPVEPPWYGPVCAVVGEGWHREVSPYPDQSVITFHRITQSMQRPLPSILIVTPCRFRVPVKSSLVDWLPRSALK